MSYLLKAATIIFISFSIIVFTTSIAISEDDWQSEARKTFFQVCSSDVPHSPTACCQLGGLWERGDGGPKDLVKARGYYKKACDGGTESCCIELGRLLLKGEGGPQDANKGEELLSTYCVKGIDTSSTCINYAFNLHSGESGVKQDYLKSKAVAEVVCEHGLFYSDRGCELVGKAYINGWGVEKDIVKAQIFLAKACEKENAEICFMLGLEYMGIFGAEYTVDIEKAKRYVLKGCELENDEACKFAQDKGWK